MWKKSKNFAASLICDRDGRASLSDCVTFLLVVSFLAVSLYLMIRGLTWQHYDAFALYSVGPSSALKAASKYINSMNGRRDEHEKSLHQPRPRAGR